MNIEMKQRFDTWWACGETDRPLIRLIGRKDETGENAIQCLPCTAFDFHLSPQFRVAQLRKSLEYLNYYLDSFAYVDLNMGPGSMAAYLACTPEFSFDTIWYNESGRNLTSLLSISYEKSSKWWKTHLAIISKAVELAHGEFAISIPDIQENLDIVAAMRGAQNLCYDLIDEPDMVKKVQAIVDAAFYKYYEDMYNLVKDKNGDSAFTAFSIWGRGKTAKLQCDFSAMISPSIFDEYVLPSLAAQCEYLDNTMYHLDGVDAVRHLSSILSLKKLKAMQWTPGAGQADGGSEKWFSIYDKARDAGKALWIQIYDGTIDQWIFETKQVIRRYGYKGIYIVYGETTDICAKKLIRELKF